MDTWGFILLGIGVIVYFVVKDKRWGCGLSGIGLGIIVGALGSYVIIRNLLR